MSARPSVGMLVNVHGRQCRITHVHKFGTIDVVSLCGNYAWRLTGLDFL